MQTVRAFIPSAGATDIIPLIQIWRAVKLCELKATLSFLGQHVPRVERTRTNMSVGHAMKPMSEAHFAILRRHMVEVIGRGIGCAGVNY